VDELARTRWYRFLEILPGLTSWLILTLPFIASFWYPQAVAIFIVIYVVIWFLRALKSSAFSLIAFFRYKRREELDWNHLLSFFSDRPPTAQTPFEKKTVEAIKELKAKDNFKKADELYHVVIMPTYKEEKEVLDSSLKAFTEVDYPHERIIFVLATEERDRKRAEENAAYIEKKYAHVFGQFHVVMHPADMPNEIPAKGGNISYAGAYIAEKLRDQGVDFSNVVVTTLDADNRPHPKYFSVLTYHYLIESERKKRSYQSLAFFYNNIWEVPFINRLVALANSFWFLAESGESYRLFNAAAYALSLDALEEMDYWSRQTIIEDLHQFWRAYFHFKGNHKVIPLFIPVYQDALENKTYFTSLLGQYKQLRRWAWGAAEVAYGAMKWWKMRKEVPFCRTFIRVFYLYYVQVMWATGPVILFFNQSIPTITNPGFANSLFAYNVQAALSVIFTIMLIGIVVYLLMTLLSLPRPTGRFRQWRFAGSLLQWLLLPFATIIYGSIPALDAQTRIMLGKRLGFTVTEKIRKINTEEA